MQRLIMGVVLLALVWTGGLMIFIGQLPRPTGNAYGGSAHDAGVAVYTGGGGARISAAMAIFADGAGERLLISGVHPDTSRARLAEFWTGSPDLFECCVDLDRKALTTEGNAQELSAWAQTHEYERIILVTSEYHMPRAVATTKARMPDAVLTPYPVASGYLDGEGRPVSLKAWEELAGEYMKFILAHIKAAFAAPGR